MGFSRLFSHGYNSFAACLGATVMGKSEMATMTRTEDLQMMEDADELFNAHLSDEDILNAFLKDGCDLDGTPLLLWKDEPFPQGGRIELLH